MIAVYPGSFDPFTLGHLSIVKRAVKLFDRVLLIVANNASKTPMFDSQTRHSIVIHTLSNEIDREYMSKISVVVWGDTTAEYVEKVNAGVIIRGIRNSTDLQYEENLETYHNDMTRAQTIYLRPELEHSQTSSSLARMYIQTNAYAQLERYISKNALELIIHKRKEEGK